MRIERHRSIQRFLTLFAILGFALLICFGYILMTIRGVIDFNVINFLIFIGVVFGDILVFLITYIIIRICTKNSYYIINIDSIKLFKKEKEILNIPIQAIEDWFYLRVIWILLMQFGAGYLNFNYIDDDKVKKHYEIAMSRKDLLKLNKIFGEISIK